MAAELKKKISDALAEAIADNPDNEHLQDELLKLGGAHISTIDSFFSSPVRENFEKLGLEPDFKMGDNSTIDIISNSVLNDVILEYMDDFTDDFKLLLEITNCEVERLNRG